MAWKRCESNCFHLHQTKIVPSIQIQSLIGVVYFFLKLCELLNVKEDSALPLPTPVEPALEANELAINTNGNKTTPQSNPVAATQSNVATGISNNVTASTVPKCVQAPSGTVPIHMDASKPMRKIDQDARIRREFVRKLKIECDNYGIAAGISESNRASGSSDNDATYNFRYEVPDINLSNTAVRILGNRKELEMHEFSKKSSIPQSTTGGRPVSIPIIDPSGDRGTNDQ